MDRKQLKRLRRELSDELENDLYVSDVNIIDKLIEEGYLSADDWESINSLNRHKKKVKQLIKCLGRTENPLETYAKLCELLDKGHKHLVPKVKYILDGYRDLVIYRRKLCEENRLLGARVPGEHDEKWTNSDEDSPLSNRTSKTYLNSNNIKCAQTSAPINISGTMPTIINDLNRNACVVTPKHGYPGNRPHQQFRKNIDIEQAGLSKLACFPMTHKTRQNIGDVFTTRPISCENTEPSSEEDIDIHMDNTSVCELSWERKNLSHECLQTKKGQHSSRRVLPSCDRLNNNELPSYMLIGSELLSVASNHNLLKENAFVSNYLHENQSSMSPRTEGEISDIECNIHLKTSVDTCSECNGRGSRSVCDENSNYYYRHLTVCFRESNNDISNKLKVCSVSDNERNEHVYGECHPSCSECFRPQSDSPLENAIGISESHKYRKQIISPVRELSDMNVLENGCCESYKYRKTQSVSSESSSESSLRSTSESEMNTDINKLDLGIIETKMYKKLQLLDGSLSDFMDSMIENGKLNHDDILSIEAQGGENRKLVLLAKLICKPTGLNEHDEMTCDSAVEREDSSENYIIIPENQMTIYKYPMTVIKNFDKTFDVLIDKVNNGYIDVSMLPAGQEEQCITYYLQACDKLYHNSVDAVEVLIDKAAEAATRSKHQVQLQGEIFTAKTWLYLATGRVGKMLGYLEEHEQLLAFMPGIWSSNAYGWFYHDYARCFLQLQGYSNNKHKHAKEYYKSRALECARKSIEYFRNSDNSDGPIGVGFASSLLIDALLEVDGLDYGRCIDIPMADIGKADEVLQFVKQQFSGDIPQVLKTSYLLNKCDICYRKYQYLAALGYAEECFRLCAEMEIHRNLNCARKRIETIRVILETNALPVTNLDMG